MREAVSRVSTRAAAWHSAGIVSAWLRSRVPSSSLYQDLYAYLHISIHIYTYIHVTRIYAYLHMSLQHTATHLVMLSGVSRMCALCSSWGLAVSLDTATSSAVSPHRSMFL